MPNDKRRKVRKPIERRVWIDAGDGSVFAECKLLNMSETGAKLVLGAPKQLPDSFILRLSKDGRVARKCRLAWNSGNEIGVAFTARLVTAESNPV